MNNNELTRKFKDRITEISAKYDKIQKETNAADKTALRECDKEACECVTAEVKKAKKNGLPDAVIKGILLSAAASLAITGWGIYALRSIQTDGFKTNVYEGADNQPGLYIDKSGNEIVLHKDGRMYQYDYVPRPDGTIKTRIYKLNIRSTSEKYEVIYDEFEEKLLYSSENEKGITKVTQNSVTGLKTVTYYNKLTKETITNATKQYIMDRNFNVKSYLAQFDKDGNAIVAKDSKGKWGLVYEEEPNQVKNPMFEEREQIDN